MVSVQLASQEWDQLDHLMYRETVSGPIHRAVSAVITRSGSWYLLIWEGRKASLKQVGAKGQKMEEPKIREGASIRRQDGRVTLHGEGGVYLFGTSRVVEERDFSKINNHAYCRIDHTPIN